MTEDVQGLIRFMEITDTDVVDKFTNPAQVLAYSVAKTNIDDALKFTNQNQVRAYLFGVTNIDDALKFSKCIQTFAYRDGASINLALQIESDDMYSCYHDHKNDAESLIKICGLTLDSNSISEV